ASNLSTFPVLADHPIRAAQRRVATATPIRTPVRNSRDRLPEDTLLQPSDFQRLGVRANRRALVFRMMHLDTSAIIAPAANVRVLRSANRSIQKRQVSVFVAARRQHRYSERD